MTVAPLLANPSGAPEGSTGAPGDESCAACHTPGIVTGPGNAQVGFTQATYQGGQSYRMSITITDADARRWGFQLTARLARDPQRQQAGDFASVDGNSRVQEVGTFRYITHTLAGTRRGTAGPVSFDIEWRAPAATSGEVIFYLAANASNNDGTSDGDRIYLSQLRLQEQSASTPTPAIRASQPVLPAFAGNPDLGFASNGYLEIYGTDLAGRTRLWAGSDFNGSNAPTALDGVRVRVNNRDAFVYYISPTQVNINAPQDDATGPVSIQVIRDGKESNTVTVTKNRVAPALLTTSAFNVGGRQYVVALPPGATGNGPFVGRAGLIAGVAFQQVRPGDRIILYVLGAGPTNPATSAGVAAAANSAVSSPYTLRIGGVAANVEFFGIVQGTIGLYQINAIVPNVTAGDQAIELEVGGVRNNQNLFLSGVVN
jgi:uncharacterized protein (TIGR03437 family)